jgi:hemoglobin
VRLFALGVATVLGLTMAAAAADPVQRDDLDGRISKILFQSMSTGTDLYNAGQQESCARIYQGTLIAVQPLLDHRPKLMADAKTKADQALRLANPGQRATALRAVLDDLYAEVGPKKPLWDRLGGEKAVRAVVHEFVLAAAPDPKVNFFRDGRFKLDAAGVQTLEQRLVELMSAVSGGPLKYAGRDMKSAHAGMKITDAEFDALAGHLVATLKKFKVPQRETDELVGIVAGTKKDIVEKQ